MYTPDILIQGFPGRAICHGGLGWSTTTLLRNDTARILVDVGAFGVRHLLARKLKALEVDPTDISDIVLTHAHYDHVVNFTLFPNATIWIGERELAWAAAQPPGFNPLPELYVRELAHSPRVRRIAAGKPFLPGITAIASPGHTQGHLLFYVTDCERPILFTGDAAKNRAELLSRSVNDTDDAQASRASLDVIWTWWRRAPGTLLVPGHDVCMRLNANNQPVYVGERQAALNVWFDETLEPAVINLCCTGQTVSHRA